MSPLLISLFLPDMGNRAKAVMNNELERYVITNCFIWACIVLDKLCVLICSNFKCLTLERC